MTANNSPATIIGRHAVSIERRLTAPPESLINADSVSGAFSVANSRHLRKNTPVHFFHVIHLWSLKVACRFAIPTPADFGSSPRSC